MKNFPNIRFEFVSKVSDEQFHQILDQVSNIYTKSNKFWQHLKVDFQESREFFEAYLSNCDVMTIAVDTQKDNKIVGALLGVEIFNGDLKPFINWKNTPKMEPYIDMLKHIIKKADQSKIPKGRVFFGKTVFANVDYPKLGKTILSKHHENLLHIGGFKSHTGFASNKKIFSEEYIKQSGFYDGGLGIIIDHKEFNWKNTKPFKDMLDPPFMIILVNILENALSFQFKGKVEKVTKKLKPKL